VNDDQKDTLMVQFIVLVGFVGICVIALYFIMSAPTYTGRMGDDVRMMVHGLR